MTDKVILLVEDNPDDERLTVRALKKNNVLNEIIITRDGEEALDYLFGRGIYENRDLDIMPALILLDIKLPKIDGLEVLKQIRNNELTKKLSVVILTSSKEDHDLEESYDLNVNSYIRKPVDFSQFVEVIKQLGSYWLILNERPNR